MNFYPIRKETVDLLVSEDHTKTTSILHWIQVDILFESFDVKNVILSFSE